MRSPAQIKREQQEVAEQASRENKEPYVVWNEDEIDEFPPFPFPDLGNHVPEGWEYIDEREFFVDASGFGSSHEPALTIEQFKRKLKEFLEEHSDEVVGFGIYEKGQFQLYVASYRKVEDSEVE